MSINRSRLQTIDTLRGIAALSVCLFHYTNGLLQHAYVPAVASLFRWGGSGVTVFFVISGFILPYMLYARGYRLQDFGRFTLKRLVRIWPPSWAVILLFIAQWGLYEHLTGKTHPYLVHLTVPDVLCNFTYAAPFLNVAWIYPALWTLAVEVQYYIVIGLVYPLAFRNIRSFIGLCVPVLVLMYLPVPQQEFFFKWGALFLTGCVTMLYYVRRISLAAYLSTALALTAYNYFHYSVTATLFALATSLTISFVPLRSAIGSFFGKISYSIYLLHVLCGQISERLLAGFVPTGNTGGKLLLQAVCLCLTIGASWVFYFIVERYFIRQASRLFRRSAGRNGGIA